jgi:arylformamidase
MTIGDPDRETFGDGWIDISRPLGPRTPVWPGDRAFELEQSTTGGLLVSSIATTCHVGTHVDAPLHLGPSGISVHEIPLGRLLGPAEVVRLPDGCGAAGCRDLPLGWVPRHPRVLFRTDSHPVDSPIVDGFSATSAELVNWLADHGVATLGIDTPSVDVFSSIELEAHHALNRRGMTWIEGLNLTGVEAGCYTLVALPLPLRGIDAAPVRALLKRIADQPEPRG